MTPFLPSVISMSNGSSSVYFAYSFLLIRFFAASLCLFSFSASAHASLISFSFIASSHAFKYSSFSLFSFLVCFCSFSFVFDASTSDAIGIVSSPLSTFPTFNKNFLNSSFISFSSAFCCVSSFLASGSIPFISFFTVFNFCAKYSLYFVSLTFFGFVFSSCFMSFSCCSMFCCSFFFSFSAFIFGLLSSNSFSALFAASFALSMMFFLACPRSFISCSIVGFFALSSCFLSISANSFSLFFINSMYFLDFAWNSFDVIPVILFTVSSAFFIWFSSSSFLLSKSSTPNSCAFFETFLYPSKYIFKSTLLLILCFSFLKILVFFTFYIFFSFLRYF